MSDQTQTASQAMYVSPLQQLVDDPNYSVPSGNDLFIKLMGAIEPELLPDAVDTLTEKYKNETEQETIARADRYDKAFAEYDKQLAAYLADMSHTVMHSQKSALASTEQHDRAAGMAHIQDLESQMSSF